MANQFTESRLVNFEGQLFKYVYPCVKVKDDIIFTYLTPEVYPISAPKVVIALTDIGAC